MTLLLALLMALSPTSLIVLQRYAELHDRPALDEGLHDEQASAYRDPHQWIVEDCGRRSGKTSELARELLRAAEEHPQTGDEPPLVGYMALTKGQAEGLMWGRLQSVAARHKIPIRFNDTKLRAKHANGSEIWIFGADKWKDIERLRGFAYVLIAIDEAQAFGAKLDVLVEQVISPALGDYRGRLILAGTPNAACVGYFYSAATGAIPGFSRHSYTIHDNPYFPQWDGDPDWRQRVEEYLAKVRADHGWDEDHPAYQREYLGRWVRDEGGLVYKYDRRRNGNYRGELPAGYHWQHVIGVDIGARAPFALHCWAFSQDLPDLYGVESYKRADLSLDKQAEKVRDWQQRYSAVATVVDTGGMGALWIDEVRRRYGLALKEAEKTDKLDHIALYNNDLLAGRIQIDPEGELARELEVLQWDEDREREDKRYDNHVADASLYAHREAKHWCWTPREEPPAPGTPEYAQAVAARMREERARQVAKRKRGDKRW